MSPEDLAAIRERAEKASDGPWKIWGMTVMADPKNTSNVDDCDDVAFTVDRQRGLRTFNAEFIAHARDDVPRLLAEVELLRSERDEAARSHNLAADRFMDVTATANRLQARLDKVRALHIPVAPSPSRPWVTCSGCTNGGTYPCPTIQCLDGSDQ